MDLTHSPFVTSACEDVAEGRKRSVAAASLLGAFTDHPTIVVQLDEEHEVTETFLSLWNNLSSTASTPRELLLSVMHGITVEPSHPAYRVTETTRPGISQAQVGTDATLVFDRTGDHPVWLAVLRGH